MKNIYLILAAGVFFASCGPTTVIQSDNYESSAPPVADVSYQSFYDDLAPYGNWINYPGYGYVWAPNAGPDFRPYATNGNWLYTDAGWTWASNYNWGWAPFHYGRWFADNSYGWMWVPGNEWAPAWVSWRGGGDYYGWAPLGPRVSVDMAMNNYNPPANYWNFVPRRYMGTPGWHNYYVNQNQNVTIINNTTIINNYSGTNRSRYAYAPGPDPNEVRRYSGNNFKPVQLRQSSTPGARMNGSQYVIYQPRVSSTTTGRTNDAGRPSTPAPARYDSYNNTQRPATQPPSNYDPRPTTNGQRPTTTQPPANYDQRPTTNGQRPTTTQPPANYDQRPTTNGQRPTTTQPPANNLPPNNSRTEPKPVYEPRPISNESRANSQLPATNNQRPVAQPAPNYNQRPTANDQRPTNQRPITQPQPAPVQRASVQDNKPDPRPVEKPKTRQADNNN